MMDTGAKTSSQNGAKAAGVEPSVSASADQVADPEVVPKAKRRRFTKTYKLRILKQADGPDTAPAIFGVSNSIGFPLERRVWDQKGEC